jgi:amino acid adenylation domain-containing protein
MSYRQLEHAAAAMARQLRQLGAAPGHPVAHFMDRTPESIAAILAILRSGAAYVPIDPSYPSERRRFVLHDAGIDLAVTASPLAEQIRGMVRQTVVADAADAEATDATPLPQLEPHQTAYIIYTSGSSGRPKGVRISHRNLLSSTEARVHYYAEPPARFLLVPSFAFDSSIAVIFWTLAAGGTLVLADSDDARDPERLGALIRDHRVSDLLSIPTLYRELLRLPDLDLRSLKRVIVAGESCPPSLVAAHYERLSATALVNEYGPTEVTVWATAHACGPTDGDAASVPIGRPIANSAAYVLDQNDQPVPVGVAGELFLGDRSLHLLSPTQPGRRATTVPMVPTDEQTLQTAIRGRRPNILVARDRTPPTLQRTQPR